MPQFNKMFVMIPVMLAARKLDSEDPNTVQYLRMAYLVMHSICIVIVLYSYTVAYKLSSVKQQIVYVPPPPQPFADPNAKIKYTEIEYGNHVLGVARNLVGSTLFGIVLTCGLHYYKGMVMGLAIQIIMAPLNLYENPLVQTLFGNGELKPEAKVFGEKKLEDLTADDEIVDKNGNLIVRQQLMANNKTNKTNGSNDDKTTKTKSFESILLDAWDLGERADLTELVASLTTNNVNYQTKHEHCMWTPLMICCGLKNKNNDGETSAAITKCLELNADLTLVDKDGWTCLHWASYHNNATAASQILDSESSAKQSLLNITDKEGKTALDTAKQEKNEAVVTVLEQATEIKKDK